MVKENIQLAQPVLAAIRRIADDRQSGAAEMLTQAAEVFALPLTAPEAATEVDSARHLVLTAGVLLVEAQPEMASLINLASHVVAHAKRAAHADEVIATAKESARDFVQRAEVAAQAATAHALEFIGDGATVLTHSRSSTVLAALLSAHRAGRYLHVMATESRPLFEGRALAETLAGEGVRVTLMADAAAALMVKRADFVLFGADRVTPDGLVNKVGTQMIALAARAYGIAVHALCDTSKFIAALPRALPDQPRSGDELWPDAPPSVALFNRYFEPTSLRLFTTIITEDGALRPEVARLRAAAHSIDAALQAALDQLP